MRVPVSTYRIQFHKGFGFSDARALVPYLHNLGATDLYASPIFKAKIGSTSGYDVTDPLQLNPELGSEGEFEALVEELRSHNIGLLVDIVPNHMAADAQNPWWMDVLENGPSSPYATFFDIDWDPGLRAREDRVVRPVLGAPFGKVLEDQEFSLTLEEEGFLIRYYGRKFPVDPKTYGAMLGHVLHHSGNHELGMLGLQELVRLIEAVENLPPATATDPEQIEQRLRDKENLKRRLWNLYKTNSAFQALLNETIRVFNGEKGNSRSFDRLEALLDAQRYTLSYWRVAREKVNYRRFFDIADLVGVRMEEPDVFETTHGLLLRLTDEGKVTGVRVDHIDGLFDPQDYLQHLRRRAPEAYLVVEKILHGDEALDPNWPVAGTTGYDFLNSVHAVLLDPGGLGILDSVYTRFTGLRMSLAEVLHEQKRGVVDQLFAGEALSLGVQLGLLADEDRHARDLSPAGLREALVEVTICLDVYRTYIRSAEVSATDRQRLEGAVLEASRRRTDLDRALFEFVRHVLLLEFPPGLSSEQRRAWERFVRRWQQFTSPVMAKGLEDTAFYVYNRLISMNDVGGIRGPMSIAEFHQFQQARLAGTPFTMNATSTHDTKRSEDVRARIVALSELPESWAMHLSRWRNLNSRAKPVLNGTPVPDANEEILIYQTLVGAWPLDAEEVPSFRERLQAYLVKAQREAKVHTSWMTPNGCYEEGVARFINTILEPSEGNRFLTDFLLFQKRIASHGALTSLAQVLLRLTSPGVPDTYQGTELWDFSLVDPDNRRPVDYERRERLLATLGDRTLPDLLRNWQDGAVKLYLIRRTLAFRAAHSSLFLEGDYIGLSASGPREQHVLSFARRLAGFWCLVATPRFAARLSPAGNPPLGGWIWRGTLLHLPAGAPRRWTNLLTDETVEATEDGALPVRNILRRFPVALLRSLPEIRPEAQSLEAVTVAAEEKRAEVLVS